MPEAFPVEFHHDVVAVARKRETALSQIAKDFGISESCLHRGCNKQMLKTAYASGSLRPSRPGCAS